MFKNIIIAILILIILVGATAYWYVYIREPVIDPPIVTFTPVIVQTPTPIPTQPPVLFQIRPTPIPVRTPTPTVDPYWVPGDWGPYVYG